MSPKNSIKLYEAGASYHLYNRGVEKRPIFLDDQDYKVFLNYLKVYLLPKSLLQGSSLKVAPSRQLKNFSDQIDLVCFCLMPNHFHLLVKQDTEMGIRDFVRALCTRYSVYFNKKYERVGRLFQGIYKAVKVESEEQLVYLSKYIHLNPQESKLDLEYSSLRNYLGEQRHGWVKPEEILGYFSETNPNLSYSSFLNQPDLDMDIYQELQIDTLQGSSLKGEDAGES